MTRAHYKMLAERRKLQIDSLLRQLSAEKRLNAALSKLDYLPASKQCPAKLKQLRRAMTIKANLQTKKAA